MHPQPCRRLRPCNRSCGTFRCRRRRRRICRLRSCRRCRPSLRGGSFAGKAPYIQGGIGRIESIAADRAYTKAAQEGKFPLTFNITNIDSDGATASADVTATSALGTSATQSVQFVTGPSPSGWQIAKAVRSGSALRGRLIHRVHRTCAVVLSAVTIVAALGLSGCSDDTRSAPSPTPVPVSQPPTVPPSPTETGAPLPPPTALTDLMSRLADPNIPGTDKVGLVQHGTPADAAALDRFGKALQDSGYAPLTFEATDLTWAA